MVIYAVGTLFIIESVQLRGYMKVFGRESRKLFVSYLT